MKLQKIGITNFKGLKEAVLSPTSFGCLVGENNAGKSSILQAIVYALNRPTQLPTSLFYDPTASVEITLDFSDIGPRDLLRLSEEHRTKIEELVNDGAFTLSVRWRAEEKCEVSTRRLLPVEQKYRPENISAVFKGKSGNAIRQALTAEYPEFESDAPSQLNITQAKAHIEGKISGFGPEQFEWTSAPLPSGIPSSISSLLPEPIYVPAVKNLNDDLKTTQSTSFGRLLGLLLDDLTPELATIHKSFEELDILLNRVLVNGTFVDNRHEKVKSLEGMVESFLSENFPAVKIELNIPRPELKTILNAAQIYVDDGSKDLIDNKGDGIKRSLTFALLQAYVSRLGINSQGDDEATPLPRPLIFLFEEPELYLHPKSQRVLFQTLARISEKYQVLVTTHSPLFFAPGVTASFVRVAKETATPKPVGKLYPVIFALDQDNAEVFRMARFENADAAFFSRRVVLFEGESDDAFCRHVAAKLRQDWDFDRENIALVRVSGKGNFAKFRRFFESFGIDVKLVADLDAIFEGFQHLGAPSTAIEIRSAAIQTIDSRIKVLNIPAEPLARQIKDKMQQDTWRGRYAAAKETLREMQRTRIIDDAALQRLDELFVWEQDIARIKACREDSASLEALVPLIDELRQHGIFVLSKGAIEDYYPETTSKSGAKPERALQACKLVVDKVTAEVLCAPLAPGRPCELSEIFAEVFR
jgi:predicted ATP-dependent endonuclease of OLD family